MTQMEEAIREKLNPPTFAVRLRQDFWLNVLQTDISDKDLFDRLTNHWSALGTVSGLIAGFTYIASSSGDIEFTQNDGYLGDHRIHIFGLLSMLSFIISLSAASLFGIVNSLGYRNAKWFVKDSWWLIDLPIKLNIAGIIVMLASAMVSVGGIVTDGVYWTIVAFGIIVVVILFCVIQRTLDHSYRRICWSRDQPQNNQRNDDLKEAGSTVKSHLEKEHTNVIEEIEK